MHQFEKQFDGCCDDIFQNAQLTRAFACPPPSVRDVLGRLTVALLAGQSLVVPASFLIDHAPIRSLLANQEWCTFLFSNGLLKVSSEQATWDAFLERIAGGTSEGPPIVMASDYYASQQLVELWRRDGPGTAVDAYHGRFPFVRDVIEQLKAFAPVGGPHVLLERPVVSYQRCLNATINQYEAFAAGRFPIEHFRSQLATVANRGDALRTIDSLHAAGDVSDTAANELRRLSTVAKHLEMLSRLGLTSAKNYGRSVTEAIPATPFRKDRVWDAPVLGEALSGTFALEDLRAIASDLNFIEARDRFLRLRRQPGKYLIEAGMAAAETCRAAGQVLGKRAAQGTVHVLDLSGRIVLPAGLSLGARLLIDPSLAAGFPGAVFVAATGLGLLLLAAARPVQATVNAMISRKWLSIVRSSTGVP